MEKRPRSYFVEITDRIANHVYLISGLSLVIAISAAVLPVNANWVTATIGLFLFAISALVHGRAMLTREMKSAQELGFRRNRDLLIYAGSPLGMSWWLIGFAIFALLISLALEFSQFGNESGGSCLLAFSVFALLGSVARLRRAWPSGNYTTN